MAKVRKASYRLEQFFYYGRGAGEARLRPLFVVALLGPALHSPALTSNLNVPRNSPKVSLSMLGQSALTDDDRGNDYFLPPFDHGHLLGHQYGGSDDSPNLVPMLRRENRGGDWARLESTVTSQRGWCVLAIKCHYSPVDDPRFPELVEAAVVALTDEAGRKLDAEWGTWVSPLNTSVEAAGRDSLLRCLRGYFSGHLPAQQPAAQQAAFSQTVFAAILPLRGLHDPEGFKRLFEAAYRHVLQTGWTLEGDDRSPFCSEPEVVPDGQEFTPLFRLPARYSRPYAALDYMALEDQLDGRLEGGNDAYHNIKGPSVYGAPLFNRDMKSFAMHANLILNHGQMAGQQAYLSDAADDLTHRDDGTAGQGIVLDPEFDHIIPRNPDDRGLGGPTVFSNLQLTSPRYNSQKGDHLWIGPDVTVGRLQTVYRETRGVKRRREERLSGTKRERDTADTEPSPAKRPRTDLSQAGAGMGRNATNTGPSPAKRSRTGPGPRD